MAFRELDAHELKLRPFDCFDMGWGLVAAGTEQHNNCMTISWGTLGTVWNKPTVSCYVCASRYTKEFLDANEFFSINLFEGRERRALGKLGSISGRDCDKLAACDLTQTFVDGMPIFKQASIVLLCRKAYAGVLDPNNMADQDTAATLYAEGNVHTMYIGYVEKILASSKWS